MSCFPLHASPPRLGNYYTHSLCRSSLSLSFAALRARECFETLSRPGHDATFNAFSPPRCMHIMWANFHFQSEFRPTQFIMSTDLFGARTCMYLCWRIITVWAVRMRWRKFAKKNAVEFPEIPHVRACMTEIFSFCLKFLKSFCSALTHLQNPSNPNHRHSWDSQQAV